MHDDSNSLAVVILSAGRSSRINSDIPKVFHPIGNLPMIVHTILVAMSMKPVEIILVVSSDILDEIQNAIAKYIQKKDCNILIVIQEIQDGTASAALVAMMNASRKYKNALILCADTPLIEENSLHTMLKLLENPHLGLVLLTFESKTNTGYGRIVFDSNGIMQKIVEFCDEKESQPGAHLFNSGVIAGKYDILLYLLNQVDNNNTKKEYYLTDIVYIAYNLNLHVKYVVTEKTEVIGINSREDLANAEKIFQKKMCQKCLFTGVTLIDQKNVFFSYDTKIGRDSIIHPYVFFGTNVLIHQRVTIYPFSHILDCEIQNQSSIGPFSSISGNSSISNDVKIGNFVELKRSIIQNNVKIKHLSYIGDAEIGEHSNIGAGTVFCNYDGKQKHFTKIGKRCFVGANNSIVAPIEIGDEVKTGAGSIIYQNVPEEHIAVSRANQVNKKRKKHTN